VEEVEQEVGGKTQESLLDRIAPAIHFHQVGPNLSQSHDHFLAGGKVKTTAPTPSVVV